MHLHRVQAAVGKLRSFHSTANLEEGHEWCPYTLRKCLEPCQAWRNGTGLASPLISDSFLLS